MENYLWNRQKGEPTKAYSAFLKFLEMPAPRNIADYPINGLPERSIQNYFSKWDWELRAKEYDESASKSVSQTFEISQVQDIKSFRREVQNRFEWLAFTLLDKLNTELSEILSQSEKKDSEYIIKLICSASKSYSDLQKLEFAGGNSALGDFQAINEMIAKDDTAREKLFELIDRLNELKSEKI